jgi:hypothetical protein
MRPLATVTTVAGLLCAALASGCGDTLQDQPIGRSALEAVIVKSHFPVYWAGTRFAGMRLTSVAIDPGGAVTIQYGDCLVGGQYTCVTPLSVVTSPDNSFLPGGAALTPPLRLRGVAASAAQSGATLALRTGGVIVSLYARDRQLARKAAQTIVPLNEVGVLGAALPAPVPDTGFDRLPLRSQLPPGAALSSSPTAASSPSRSAMSPSAKATRPAKGRR